MVYTLWIVHGLIFISLVVTLTVTVSATYVVSAMLAALTLYDLTSDLCEYWVYTRPHNLSQVRGKKEADITIPSSSSS